MIESHLYCIVCPRNLFGFICGTTGSKLLRRWDSKNSSLGGLGLSSVSILATSLTKRGSSTIYGTSVVNVSSSNGVLPKSRKSSSDVFVLFTSIPFANTKSSRVVNTKAPVICANVLCPSMAGCMYSCVELCGCRPYSVNVSNHYSQSWRYRRWHEA